MDDKIRVVNVETERQVVHFEHECAKLAWFMKCCMNSDKSQLIMGTDTTKVELFDVKPYKSQKGARGYPPTVAPDSVHTSLILSLSHSLSFSLILSHSFSLILSLILSSSLTYKISNIGIDRRD